MQAPNDKPCAPDASTPSSFPAATGLVGAYGEQLFRILEQAASGYVLLDSQNRIQRWNEGYLRLFPWLRPLVRTGADFENLLQFTQTAPAHSATATAQLKALSNAHRLLLAKQQTSQEQQLPDGRSITLAASPLSAGYTLITYRTAAVQLRHSDSLSFFDALSNLPNRRLLLDRLSHAMIQSERTGWRGALLNIDLQQFKTVTQGASSEAVAALVAEITQRLLGCMRANDTVARLDDEHFVIMVSDLSPDMELAQLLVERMGERLLESLNAPYLVNGRSHTLQAHIGATLFGPHSRSATELLSQAEAAMYKLRDEETRGLHFFKAEPQLPAPQRQQMEQELREALRLGQFQMQYQPQYSQQGEMTGLEALLRWHQPGRGVVPPRMFIAVAEESGIIVPLGQWVIQTVCEQIALWKNDPQLCTLAVAVNISLQQLQHHDFARQVEQIVKISGIAPRQLLLEFSATQLQNATHDNLQTLRQLAAGGIRLSLDNFGATHFSQNILMQLPLFQLKIAQTLVQRLGPNNASEAAMQAAVGVAKQLKIQIVASGVETLEQRALLVQNDCQHFLGYLFSVPVPASQLKLLQHSKPAHSTAPYLAA